MKKTYKKIIAREFLILLGAIILYLVAMFSWVGLYEINYSKKIKLENEIEKLTKIKPSGITEQKALELYNFFAKENYDLGDFDNFISALTDTMKRKELFFFFEKEGYDIGELRDFKIRENDNEFKKYLSKMTALKKDLKKNKNSIFSKDIDNGILVNLGVIIFSIFFLLRYVIYGTKWSIKQMKE